MAKKTMKLSQLSKDFAMKSKDVLDAFKDLDAKVIYENYVAYQEELLAKMGN
jgi:hypothetical protein